MELLHGEITKEFYNIEFITLDSNFYQELELDVSSLIDKNELIQEINNLYVDSSSVYQIKLIGTRNFFIDVNEIIKYVKNENILKFKNETISNYNFEELAIENTLKGYFVKNLLEKMNDSNEYEKKELEKAIEIGLELLN